VKSNAIATRFITEKKSAAITEEASVNFGGGFGAFRLEYKPRTP